MQSCQSMNGQYRMDMEFRIPDAVSHSNLAPQRQQALSKLNPLLGSMDGYYLLAISSSSSYNVVNKPVQMFRQTICSNNQNLDHSLVIRGSAPIRQLNHALDQHPRVAQPFLPHYKATYSSSSTSSTDARCGCRCTIEPIDAASEPVGCGAESTSAEASGTGVAVPGSGEAPPFLLFLTACPLASALAACFAAFFSFLARFLALMSSGV
jgi:hypothetical protein